MGFLDELKKICADYTEKANTKEEIDFSVKLTNITNGLAEEEAQTLKQYDELKQSYKDAVLHGTFGEKKPVEPTTDGQCYTFEEYLQRAIDNRENSKK